MKNRILSIDILRGLGIMVIIIIHRLHYHWAGMRSTEILREHFSSAWAPLLITVIALFTMAGIFYFISGTVNAYSFYKNAEYKGIAINKIVKGGVLGGIWIFILNYVHRLFFSNGFIFELDGSEPEFPVGYLVGWIRNPQEVRFYISQLTEPGTLAVIGLVVVVISLTLGILLQPRFRKNKKRIYKILIIAGFIGLLLTPVVKFYLRPAYELAYQSNNYLLTFIYGHFCQEFSLSPYLGYGFFGAIIGIGLAAGEDLKIFYKRNRILMLILLGIGVLCVVLFNREDTFGKWIIGAGITYIELSLFILILTFLLRRIDFRSSFKKIEKRYKFTTIRSFGMVALTVYFFEPTLAELFIKIINSIVGNNDWTNQIQWILLFGFFLLGVWTIILYFWKKINFAGSLEWISVKLMFLLAKKRSGKTEFDTIK